MFKLNNYNGRFCESDFENAFLTFFETEEEQLVKTTVSGAGASAVRGEMTEEGLLLETDAPGSAAVALEIGGETVSACAFSAAENNVLIVRTEEDALTVLTDGDGDGRYEAPAPLTAARGEDGSLTVTAAKAGTSGRARLIAADYAADGRMLRASFRTLDFTEGEGASRVFTFSAAAEAAVTKVFLLDGDSALPLYPACTAVK